MPVAINLDLTLPTFAGQSGLRITPKTEVSFYGNWYKPELQRIPSRA